MDPAGLRLDLKKLGAWCSCCGLRLDLKILGVWCSCCTTILLYIYNTCIMYICTIQGCWVVQTAESYCLAEFYNR